MKCSASSSYLCHKCLNHICGRLKKGFDISRSFKNLISRYISYWNFFSSVSSPESVPKNPYWSTLKKVNTLFCTEISITVWNRRHSVTLSLEAKNSNYMLFFWFWPCRWGWLPLEQQLETGSPSHGGQMCSLWRWPPQQHLDNPAESVWRSGETHESRHDQIKWSAQDYLQTNKSNTQTGYPLAN